jgi:hypothetical protein
MKIDRAPTRSSCSSSSSSSVHHRKRFTLAPVPSLSRARTHSIITRPASPTTSPHANHTGAYSHCCSSISRSAHSCRHGEPLHELLPEPPPLPPPLLLPLRDAAGAGAGGVYSSGGCLLPPVLPQATGQADDGSVRPALAPAPGSSTSPIARPRFVARGGASMQSG